MRVPRREPRAFLGINLTPLIDIVFQLIVFFLVTSHLAQQEAALELELPPAESARPDLTTESPRIILNLLPGSEDVWVAGRRLDLAGLRVVLEAERRQRGDQMELRIRADRHTNYQQLEPILALCAELGIRNVTLATVQP
jgi:biopolymer transport protein ExbD